MLLFCPQIYYIHATRRFILTQQPTHPPEILTILKGLLHPDDRFLFTNMSEQLVFEKFSFSKGTIHSNFIELNNRITIVKKGVVGVSHRMHALVNWSHFYTAGDLVFNLEIHEDLNRMETKWHVLNQIHHLG